MFCARVLRTPKRFESPTGSNISTSTPVSTAKRLPEEPNHSPIERSNDNSKDFNLEPRTSVNVKKGPLPFSPLVGNISYLRSKRALILGSDRNTPNCRTENTFSGSAKGYTRSSDASKKLPTLDNKQLDYVSNPDDRPVQGIRMSPRNLSKNAQIQNTNIPKKGTDKENKTGGRARSRSNIPMRRKSVSLQDLATIGNKQNLSQHKHSEKPLAVSARALQTTKQPKRAQTTQQPSNNVKDSTSLQVPKRKFTNSRSKSDVVSSNLRNVKIVDDKAVGIKSSENTLKLTTNNKQPAQTKPKKSEEQTNKSGKTTSACKSNEQPVKTVPKKQSENTIKSTINGKELLQTKSKKSEEQTNKDNKTTSACKSNEQPVKTVPKKQSENTIKSTINGKELLQTKSKKSEEQTNKDNKTTSACKSNEQPVKTVPKKQSENTIKSTINGKELLQTKSKKSEEQTNKDNKTTSACKSNEQPFKTVPKKQIENITQSKPINNQVSQEKVKKIDNEKCNNGKVQSKSNDNNQISEQPNNKKEPSASSILTSGKGHSKPEDLLKSDEGDKTDKSKSSIRGTNNNIETTTNKENNERRSSPRKISPTKSVAQTKNANDSNIMANNRDSYGSQRNSDTFQVNASNKTSFVKRKLYSQCTDFNDDSSNDKDTSFLVQKDNFKNIYCLKKKIASNVEPRINLVDVSKGNDNQRTYTLRKNNRNTEDVINIQNTCKFVTKILDDINSKNKSSSSKNSEGTVSDNNNKESDWNEKTQTNVKTSKKKYECDISANDIFDVASVKVNKPIKAKEEKRSKDKKNNDKKRNPLPVVKKIQKGSKVLKKVHDDHPKSLIIATKTKRNAKTDAIEKIHNWSHNISNTTPVGSVVSLKKTERKRIIVDRECSYILRSSGGNGDANISLSPHLRKAISKLREQQSNSSRRPVRRSLKISVEKKKTILPSETLGTRQNYNFQDNSLKYNRNEETDGRVMAFKNGQLVTLSKASTSCMPQDDSFYELKEKKTICSAVPNKATKQSIHSFSEQYGCVEQTKNQNRTAINSFWNPNEMNLLKYSTNESYMPTISQHCKINSTIISQPAEITNRKHQHQLQPYYPNMHAMVSRPTGLMDLHRDFKMPTAVHKTTATAYSYGRSVPRNTNAVTYNDTFDNTAHSSKSIVFTNPLKSLTHRQEYTQQYDRDKDSYSNVTVPDFIKNPFLPPMSYRNEDPVKSSYSFCAKGIELMRNKVKENRQNSTQRNLIEQNKKRKYSDDVNDITVMSKKTKYDEDMSLCSSLAYGKPMSSTRINDSNTHNQTQRYLVTNQSVCKFIIGGPLLSDPNKTTHQQLTTRHVYKPHVQMIASTKHTVIEQVNNADCHFSNDLNETVINTKSTNTLQPKYNRETIQRHRNPPAEHQRQILNQMQHERQTINALSTQRTTGETITSTQHIPTNPIAKRYKFSSEDVYNFVKKPNQNEAVARKDDTFYFQGAYNNCPDMSGVNSVTSATVVDDTFRKPSTAILKIDNNTRPTKSHTSSILEQYYDLHSKINTPKRKPATHSTTSRNQLNRPDPECNDTNRNLVSPWRLL